MVMVAQGKEDYLCICTSLFGTTEIREQMELTGRDDAHFEILNKYGGLKRSGGGESSVLEILMTSSWREILVQTWQKF